MKINLKRTNGKAVAVLFVLAFLALAAYGHTAVAEESRFRTQFRESYEKNAFKSLEFLIRQNASKVTAEVDTILEEAKDPKLSYPERMKLIDLAVTMATMHKEWNKDPGPLEKAEALQIAELKKERARQAEIKKWKAYELVLGNWVMKENAEAMDAEGITYALYPHWMHQIWFECRVCHTGIFIPRRGANNINKDRILKGELCGRCHDGGIAFEAKTNCKRCHVVGAPEEKRLRDVEHVDMEMLDTTAEKLGVEWHADRLPNGRIPVDKFSFVDWGWLNKMDVYRSVAKVDGIEPETESHDSKILYPSSMSFIKDAVFDHADHTPRMLCEHCHPKVFKKELGGTSTKMSAMGEGEACGYCHGKTAFKLADCKRCHVRTADEPMEKGMLLHHKRPE